MSSRITIVGGGLVGLSTAYSILKKNPTAKVTVIEKESKLFCHQSGRNSGVIHSGVYYAPGSFKARFCREGKIQLEKFCKDHQIPFRTCGKLIVATRPADRAGLDRLEVRARENGVKAERVNRSRIVEIEPKCGGSDGLYLPETGVVDFKKVGAALVALIRAKGGVIRLGTQIQDIEEATGSSDRIINCAGLHAERVARKMGHVPGIRMVPFRGEFYKVKTERASVCRGLIYPVPDPEYPFLGVHVTRMMDGTVKCGPNAVLSLGLEAYDWSQVNVSQSVHSILWPGFFQFASKHWKTGLSEVARSWSKARFTESVQALVPSLTSKDLEAYPAGIRAQAMRLDGSLVEDFHIEEGNGVVHVLNAPSPAATACLAIGDEIAGRVL